MKTKRSKKEIFTKTKKHLINIGVNKILVSKEEVYSTNKSFKNLIGYNDNEDIRPLSIMLPQMICYVKCFKSDVF